MNQQAFASGLTQPENRNVTPNQAPHFAPKENIVKNSSISILKVTPPAEEPNPI